MWENIKDFSLDEQANWNDVKSSYIEQLKVWHPDRFGSDQELRRKCEERTKLLNQTFNKLKSQLEDLGKSGVKLELDQPILPQLIQAGVTEFSKKIEPTSSGSSRKFVQEPLVSNKVKRARTNEELSQYETTLWHPKIIAAAVLSGIALLATFFYVYKALFAPKAPRVIYGAPADLSKLPNFAKKEKEPDSFAEDLEAAVAEEQMRSGDGIAEGQLGGVRIISGVSSKSAEDVPPVVKAASRCDLGRVKNLVENGAGINSEDPDGMTSLSWAAKINCDQLARYLITKGANMNHVSNNGFTPIAWARWYKNIEVMKVLELEPRNLVKR